MGDEPNFEARPAPTGKARKKLARKGKRGFGLEVEFAPQDSSPNSSSKTVKLIRK